MIRQILFALVMLLTAGACGGKNVASPSGNSPPTTLAPEPAERAEPPPAEHVEPLKEDVEVPPAP